MTNEEIKSLKQGDKVVIRPDTGETLHGYVHEVKQEGVMCGPYDGPYTQWGVIFSWFVAARAVERDC